MTQFICVDEIWLGELESIFGLVRLARTLQYGPQTRILYHRRELDQLREACCLGTTAPVPPRLVESEAQGDGSLALCFSE